MTTETDTLPRPHRRWLRLSLQGLLILVVLIAIPIGWVAHLIRTQRQAIAAVRAAGGQVQFDYQGQLVGKQFIRRSEPAAPRWVRRVLGDELFQDVVNVRFPRPVAASVLASLARFDRLEGVGFAEATGVGWDFHPLRSLARLRALNIRGPGVTDAALAGIGALPGIVRLQVGAAPATDAGFAHLARMGKLAALAIDECPNLTDPGAARMVAGLPSLTFFLVIRGPGSLRMTLPALAEHHPGLQLLTLDTAAVLDDDLASVGRLAELQELSLQQTRIGDAGLAHLKPLTGLRQLRLGSPRITDAGLVSLRELTGLRELTLYQSQVTPEGVAALQLALPKLGPIATRSGPPPVVAAPPPTSASRP